MEYFKNEPIAIDAHGEERLEVGGNKKLINDEMFITSLTIE